jgi:hypothetical protein
MIPALVPVPHHHVLRHQPDKLTERRSPDLVEAPGLRDIYAAERKMRRIPLKLADGREVSLSPAGRTSLSPRLSMSFAATSHRTLAFYMWVMREESGGSSREKL